MLQQEMTKDYVIEVANQHSVKAIISRVSKELGIDVDFAGSDLDDIRTVSSFFWAG